MQSDANGLALRSVLSSHDEFIYSLIVQRWSAFRTYYGAAMPTVRTFLDLLDRNAMAHLVVTRHQEPVGFAVALGHDLRNGIAHAVVVLDVPEPAVSTVQAAELFAAYLFAHWPLRKVYWETNRIHADIAGGSESSFLLEGVYRDYVYEDSQWQDAYVLALARESPIARAGRVIA